MTTTQLTISDATGIQVYTDGGMRPILDQIRAEVAGVVPDLTTVKGRKAIASLAAKVARSKTRLDALGKELTADQKAATKAVDAERKAMRDELDELRDDVRRPLTEWENKEKDRVASIKASIAGFGESIDVHPDTNAESWRVIVDQLNAAEINDDYAEFANEAATAKDHALTIARAKLVTAEAAEKAEAARIEAQRIADEQARIERDKRVAAEATAKAQEDAANEAQRVADARAAEDNRRERERLQAIADKQQAEANAQRKADEAVAEEKRKQAEKEAENKQIASDAARELSRRKADTEHRRGINREALAGLVSAGLDDERAKAVLVAIVGGKIPHITINY